uniref:Uncharacterized protein n=1 Tax=Leersia perrieri TaxID=77586 RepID=A0A0D9XV58_9ORYZ
MPEVVHKLPVGRRGLAVAASERSDGSVRRRSIAHGSLRRRGAPSTACGLFLFLELNRASHPLSFSSIWDTQPYSHGFRSHHASDKSNTAAWSTEGDAGAIGVG